MTFAISNEIAKKLPTLPTGISERLMPLRVPESYKCTRLPALRAGVLDFEGVSDVHWIFICRTTVIRRHCPTPTVRPTLGL